MNGHELVRSSCILGKPVPLVTLKGKPLWLFNKRFWQNSPGLRCSCPPKHETRNLGIHIYFKTNLKNPVIFRGFFHQKVTKKGATKKTSQTLNAKFQRFPLNPNLMVGQGSWIPRYFLTFVKKIHGNLRGPGDPTWMSRWKLGSMVRINGLFHLLINGVYWGYNPLILTIY